jgi:signal transduction histidine kinase
VQSGDAPHDDQSEAVVAAIREALVNVAKHSGEASASVFVEVTPTEIEAFVRDRGRGFDPEAVGVDRRGVAESIVGRLQRAGGTATVHGDPGHGTEVTITLPRSAS